MTDTVCNNCKMFKSGRCLIIIDEGRVDYQKDNYCPFREVLGYKKREENAWQQEESYNPYRPNAKEVGTLTEDWLSTGRCRRRYVIRILLSRLPKRRMGLYLYW